MRDSSAVDASFEVQEKLVAFFFFFFGLIAETIWEADL